jgi:hypothetical protein
LTFETGSRLAEISERAFSHSFSLKSICILSSVRFLGIYCFSQCTSLCSVRFDFKA